MFDVTVTIATTPVAGIDIIALVWFIAAWVAYGVIFDKRYHTTPNLMHTMDAMRMRWMQEMVKRDNRVNDATLIGNLLRSIAFFASTTILILIGLFTLLGAKQQAIGLIGSIPYAMNASPFMWEIKTILLVMIFIHAFFKLTWSLRQYNYACILVGAAPNPISNPEVLREYGNRAGMLISNAGRHFNKGLRAYYFGMAAVSWYIHALLFIGVTALVVWVLYRREFRSHTVNNLRGMETM